MAINPFSKNEATRGELTAAELQAMKVVAKIERKLLNNKITHTLFDSLRTTTIDKFCDSGLRNEAVRLGLMQLNVYEHDVTLKTLGENAALNGDSRSISGVLSPSYTQDLNYVENFVRPIDSDEQIGVNSTRQKLDADNNIGNINEVYTETKNLYYDDKDRLTGEAAGSRMVITDPNSILHKTKELFRQGKINTIISRFHTEHAPKTTGESGSKFGLSHGRNLLTKDAEVSNTAYDRNGYDNPYCRVWTHHYQYDQLMKRIRPFYKDDGNGEPEEIGVEKFHEWWNFAITSGEWKGQGWKDKGVGWDLSVLAGNHGFPRITPKFLGGGAANHHTKQCMFSIENLAWKGFDPYSFEKALPWEQRGPNGGRIMWFPPYGISFNENINTNWNSHTFIGRGEDVYTYANTVRSGTLNFMLLVDHPSIIDYVSWNDKNHSKATDTDLLRFFAGCDSGSSRQLSEQARGRNELKADLNSGSGPRQGGLLGVVSDWLAENGWCDSSNPQNSLADAATPTPLTDEYLQAGGGEEVVTFEKQETDPPVEPTIEITPPVTVQFYVFYPNNYSGVYDHKDNKHYDNVDAMAYLLFGNGAQMEYNEANPVNSKSISLTFDGIMQDMSPYEDTATGYEMNGGGISIGLDHSNRIVGPMVRWQAAKRSNSRKWVAAKVSDDGLRNWFYRIDGYYTENGQVDEADVHVNTYDQVLSSPDSYRDQRSMQLNCNTEGVEQLFGENENLISLAEFAYLLYYKGEEENNVQKLLKITGGVNTETDKMQSLIENVIGKQMSVNSVKIESFSNSHGYNNSQSVNNQRNAKLSNNRAVTIKNWLKTASPTLFGQDSLYDIQDTPSKQVHVNDEKKVDGTTSKKWRSALVTIEFKASETTTVAESNPAPIEDTAQTQAFTGFSEHTDSENNTYYTKDGDTSGKKWVYEKRNGVDALVYRNPTTYSDRSYWMGKNSTRQGNGVSGVNNGKDEYNHLRYDQEYHFFKLLEKKAPIVYSSLMDKIKYFDPAFHSMTPEGFNARLTFLNQCMRQGSTITISDSDGSNATTLTQNTNNLAFGRAPYCILRIGDFYNQMIVIDSISITYDPLQWDLNTEGIGMQPLLANVAMNFKMIGGGDLGGPIRRLQNAMSFNYYANTRLYDNRADRAEREYDYKTNQVTKDESIYRDVAMSKS